LACFTELGFGGTRLQDIAERAGVTTALLYRYFPDKDAIFEATVRRFLVPSLAGVEALVRARRGSPSAALREVLLAWWGAMTDPQVAALPRVVLGETHRFPTVAKLYAREVVGRRHRLLRDVLRWGIAVGVFREVPVDVAARVLAAPVHFGAIYAEAIQPYDDWGMAPDDYLAGAVEMAVASVSRPVP
jgi:AcrR family transcriptional regulator